MEPEERLSRGESDRERVNELRAFAVRVFEEGAHTVILLPPMPYWLSLRVISTLAAALPATLPEPPGLERLLDAVSAVRRKLVSVTLTEPSASDQTGPLPPGAVAGPVARREMALDVCLFARSPAPEPH
jgi:hypothetical protein